MSHQQLLTLRRQHADRPNMRRLPHDVRTGLVQDIREQLDAGTYDEDAKFDAATDRLIDDVLTGRQLRAAALRAVDERRIERRQAEWDRDNAQDPYDGGRLEQ